MFFNIIASETAVTAKTAAVSQPQGPQRGSKDDESELHYYFV